MTDPIVRYFDDYAPGVTFDCGAVAVDEASIIAFAKDYDPQPFHLIEARNQHDVTVLRLTAINFVRVRPAS